MAESKVQMVILYIFICVWVSVIFMVICTLCLAKHLYIHNEDDPLYYEVRAAEIKENTILIFLAVVMDRFIPRLKISLNGTKILSPSK